MMNSSPRLIKIDKGYQLVDSENSELAQSRLQRVIDQYRSYFSDRDRLELSSELNYRELSDLIAVLNKKLDQPIIMDNQVQTFIEEQQYAIREQETAGLMIKNRDKRWEAEFQQFRTVVSQEVHRPLKLEQEWASFYLTTMKRAANFSVPGSGKTAMTYGVYAYLSAASVNQVSKILVVSPLNAFESWRQEFINVFDYKRELHFLDIRDCNDPDELRLKWYRANVCVINFESLGGWKLSVLNDLVDRETMLVFDEVHRVKNPNGARAESALALGPKTRYRYVLTGTPIPNTYQDIYNFLHILYYKEYDMYFNWSLQELSEPNPEVVNDKLQPFFWRTTKQDLLVPPAEPDQILAVRPSSRQQELAETIHEIEGNVLSRYIRLLQASTNPALLVQQIDFSDLGFLSDELPTDVTKALDKEEYNAIKKQTYLNMNLEEIETPKFKQGIRLIKQLVSEGKKILVWGMFIGTMQKISRELTALGISNHLIYGETPKLSRVEMINEVRDEDVQVLISNPATLGESISLHQTIHDAVYFEYNFNLTFMLQSRDRIHRLGLDHHQYTRYYYLMSDGDTAHASFIDKQVYDRLKEKEAIMLQAVEGQFLTPEITDDYLEDVKAILGYNN